MKTKIYLLITDWAREDCNDIDVDVFTSLAAAQVQMRYEFNEYLVDYEEDTRVSDINDMTAEIYEDGYAVSKHDKWSIVEKEIDFGDMYIVPKDFDNFYVEKTQFWAGTHEAAVYTKEEADAIVDAERKMYNLKGSRGPYAVKLINDRPELIEEDFPNETSNEQSKSNSLRMD